MVTPQFKKTPKKEIAMINQIKNILQKDNRKNGLRKYPFLSVVIKRIYIQLLDGMF